ncbi:MAG: arginine--tRNA ligase [Sulfolobaceae archaeon]
MNPILEVKRDFAEAISNRFGVKSETIIKLIEYPPDETFGDLALPIPKLGKKDILNLELLKTIKTKFIKKIDIKDIFINSIINEKELFLYIYSNINENYGINKTDKPKKYIVEHTSANPVHPLHLGHLRNAVLGDTIARLLKYRGHNVIIRFYVNDVGRQVAILIYALKLLGYPDPPSNIKVDHWLGLVYAIINVLLEVRNIKKQLEKMNEINEKFKELQGKLDELVVIAKELRDRDPQIFDKLAEELNIRGDRAEEEISEIMRLYENKNEGIIKIVRKYVDLILRGFLESLSKLDISFDGMDYESEVVWSEYMNEVLDRIKNSLIKIEYKGTLALNLNDFLDEEIRERLRIPKGLEVPPLIVFRSDGSTLYTVRDIAYTLYKFKKYGADVVINVIAEQQYIPQIQLRAALYLLGYPEFASNLIHYSYGMVSLQGYKMSGRRGRYLSLDELYDKYKIVATTKINKESSSDIIDHIISSAIRYSILQVSANKPVSFSVETSLDLSQSSGPYLQYTYARAYNILSKSNEKLELNLVDFNDLVGEKRKILIEIAKFPEVFEKVADELRPEDLISYLRNIADIFNRWYDKERVLQEPDNSKRQLRLHIVKGVEIVLRNGLKVLGIKPLQRM